MSSIRISAGILAGGKSSRMGQNKVLLKLDNKRFIDRIIGELSNFDELLISAAHKGEYEDTGIKIVYDEHKEIGPIEGIYQVLKHARNEYVFVCAGDMPFVSAKLVEYMAEFISSDYDCFVLMDEERVHPICAIYSKKVLHEIEKLIEKGKYRLMDLLNLVNTKYIKLEYTNFDKKVVKNINRKEDYVNLILPVVFCVSGIKNSGKTGLIEKLINEFIKENYSVAVIKHDGHEYVMDHEGTDTYRLHLAGAAKTLIFSGTQYSMNAKGRTSIEEMIKLCDGADVIVVEGMKDSDYPKVEVVRSEVSTHTVCKEETHICVATDVDLFGEVNCPIYGINDTEKIYLCVKKYFGLE